MRHACGHAVQLFIMVLMLAACTGTPSVVATQSRVQDPKLARLYFLRPGQSITDAPAYLSIDGQRVGTLADRSYLYVDHLPGRYTLAVDAIADPGSSELVAEVRAGMKHYFLVELNLPTRGKSGLAAFLLSPLAPQTATDMLVQLRGVSIQAAR
jgi:hypothetical protein